MNSTLPILHRSTLALALSAALGVMAHSALANPINAPVTGMQTWSQGDFTVNLGGEIEGYSGPAIHTQYGADLGTLFIEGEIRGANAFSNSATVARVENRGKILANSFSYMDAVANHTSGNILVLQNQGTISATNIGINNQGSIGTLDNSGVISGDQLGILVGSSGPIVAFAPIVVPPIPSSVIGTLTNSGTITGGFSGIVVEGGSIGTLINTGEISGTDYAGVHVENNSSIGALNNAGSISGRRAGIMLESGGKIATLGNSGTITGQNAIHIQQGVLPEITNSGTIRGVRDGAGSSNGNGQPAAGIFIQHEGQPLTTTLHNKEGGIVTGADAAIGIIALTDDSNTIQGSAQAAGNGAPNTVLAVLNNSGTIAGTVFAAAVKTGNTDPVADASYSIVINGGQDTFGTLTGLDGATGKLYSYGPTVNFSTGKLLLNSDIETGIPQVALGSNSNAPTLPDAPLVVTNTAATVQVNTPIRIAGSYTQGANATLQIGVTDNAAATGNATTDAGYGRLVVQGAAVIDAGSAVTLQKTGSYAFAPGQRFVAVDASAAGTQYNESTLRYGINEAVSEVSGAAVTDAGRSRLVLTVNSVGEQSPGTPETPGAGGRPTNPATHANAFNALNGLGNYTGIDNPDLLNLFNAGQALRQGGAGDANSAGAQLSPTNAAGLASAAGQSTSLVSGLIAQRVDAIRNSLDSGSGVATGDAGTNWAAWGQVYGGHARQNRRDNVDGYGADFGGLLLGLDRGIGQRWRVGGVLSYSNTKTDFKGNLSGNDSKIDSYGLIGYAGYTADTWYANVSAGVVQQEYRVKRNIGFTGFSGQARGEFDGQQYVARAEAGYPLALGAATITPMVALNTSYTRQDRYTETGGNGAALSVGSANTTSVTSDLGLRLNRDFASSAGTLSPELQLVWRHEYRNKKTLTNASFAGDPTGQTAFTTVGAAPVRDSALVSAGLTLHSSDTLSLSARYDLQTGGGFTSHAGGLRLRKAF